MRKWIIALFVLLALVVGGIFIFIPSRLPVTKIAAINCTVNGTYTFLANQQKWNLWWPSTNSTSTDSFSRNGYTYRVSQQLYNVVIVSVQKDDYATNDTIAVLPINKDSVYIRWNSMLLTGSNPFKKIQHYRQATIFKENMDTIVASLKNFLERNENIYGTPIIRTRVKDTLLITTKEDFTGYPSTTNIYTLVNRLKQYAQEQGATETGYPMLNILHLGNDQYNAMVALPLNKAIKEDKNIFIKRMVPGKILVTETTGGIYNINKTSRQLEKYVYDHHLESPAIPFQSLITDRLAEPDTAKWITKIYYPIF